MRLVRRLVFVVAAQVSDKLAGIENLDASQGPEWIRSAISALQDATPAPFCIVFAAISLACVAALNAKANKRACRELAERVGSIAPIVAKLCRSPNKPPNTAQICERLAKAVTTCSDLMATFSYEGKEDEGFVAWAKRKGLSMTDCEADFTAAHRKLDQVTGDFNFAGIANMTMRGGPSTDELHAMLRSDFKELADGMEEIKAAIARIPAVVGDALLDVFGANAGALKREFVKRVRDEPIGQGGFATVYEARYRGDIPIAEKVYDVTAHRDMFNQEVDVLRSAPRHANLVRFMGTLGDNTIVMCDMKRRHRVRHEALRQ